jgi:hypothetical protein
MEGLNLFLGSSDPSQFFSINGYFYYPRLKVYQGQLLVTRAVAPLDLPILL